MNVKNPRILCFWLALPLCAALLWLLSRALSTPSLEPVVFVEDVGITQGAELVAGQLAETPRAALEETVIIAVPPSEPAVSFILVARRPPPVGPVGTPADKQEPRMQTPRVNVSRIVAEEPADYQERLDAIYALHMETLDNSDVRRLLDYLEDPLREKALPDATFHALVNELLAFFHQQPRLDNRYLESARRILDDERQDDVVRDYTLQSLSHAMDRASPEQARTMELLFWENTAHSRGDLAGTAFLALNRLNEEERLSPESTRRLRAQITERLLVDESAGEAVRIAAMQIAARHNLTLTADRVKTALLSGDLTPSETIAALGMLSSLGDPGLAALLETFRFDPHPIVSQSAQRMLTASLKR